MATYRIGERVPQIDETAFIAETASVIGDVRLQANTSVWPGAAVRGDNEPIDIGENSNIQEGAVLHADFGFPLTVGRNVTVGHQAMLHGCTIGEGSLIGIQAIVLNGAVIGRNCLVAAGAVVTEGMLFPDNSLILGSPAKVLRELDAAAILSMQRNTADYVERRGVCKDRLVRVD